jgi:hypothetical protein
MKQAAVFAVAALAWMPAAAASRIPVPSPMGWVIETAEYSGELKDQIARMEGKFTIRILNDGWVEVPLPIQGATITAVTVDKRGDGHIAPRGDTYVFAASRKGVYKVIVKFAHRLAQDPQYEGVELGIPQATFSSLSLFVPRKEIDLRPADQLYAEVQSETIRNGVRLTARLGASSRIDVRWRTKPAAPVKVEPILYGEVHTLASLEEQLVRVLTVINYRAAQGQARELIVRVPAGVNILNVRGAGIDDWRVADGEAQKTLTVTLASPLQDGYYQLVLEAEQVIETDSATYALPEIALEGVKQERGYIAVARTGSLELAPELVEGLNRVDVKELPEMLRAAGASPATLAFKYHQHPYRVTLALTRYQDHAVLTAIAEQGELVTVVSGQGELLTRATYLIRANKKQFLEVRLPEGASLWSCLVGRRSVKPAEGQGGKLLIPLDGMSEVSAIPVELVYFERRDAFRGVGQARLQGPTLDVPTTVANWLIYAPNELKFLRMSGNVERGAADGQFVEEPFEPIMLASLPAAEEPMRYRENESKDEKRLKLGWFGKSRRAVDQAVNGIVGDKEAYELERQELDLQNAAAPAAKAALEGGIGGRMDARDVVSELSSLSDRGILPLKVRLPKSGTVYRFNRLMTAEEGLQLDATFVHLQLPWLPAAAAGMLAMPLGGLALAKFHRG